MLFLVTNFATQFMVDSNHNTIVVEEKTVHRSSMLKQGKELQDFYAYSCFGQRIHYHYQENNDLILLYTVRTIQNTTFSFYLSFLSTVQFKRIFYNRYGPEHTHHVILYFKQMIECLVLFGKNTCTRLGIGLSCTCKTDVID